MKTSRNDPCPCGSGKKYKKCCLTETYTGIGREESAKGQIVQDLLKFYRKNYAHTLENAHSLFWGEFIPEEHLDEKTIGLADINFGEWIVYDYIIDEKNGKTLIDFFLENKKLMSLDEHNVLNMMKNSVMSLYEVQDIFPEKGLLLKDLLLSGEYDVREKLATRGLKKWDIFAARLLHVDGKYIMSGAVYPYHLRLKEIMIADIRDEYEGYRKEYQDAAMDDFLKKNSDMFNFYWYDIIQNPLPLKLHNTSGEPMLFSKAVFEIKDRDSTIKELSKIKGFEKDKENFVWYDKRNKEGSATIFGNVDIKGERLILECNSRKRLGKGKKLILDALSGSIVHKADTFHNPMEAAKSYKEDSPEKSQNELPFEVQQQFYAQFMQKHYEKWMHDKIPALNGKTPMQAIKTEEGRRKVIELLKLFENGEERKKQEGEPYYDLSWMWERLGLERERQE